MVFSIVNTHSLSFTKEQLSALAPDAATLDRALAIGKLRRWRGLGSDTFGIWGECRSSGAHYYRAVIFPSDNTYYCSCPSRPQPCKHVLALLLLRSEHPGSFAASSSQPDWVIAWQERRRRPDSPAEAEEAERQRQDARDRNRDQRRQLMAAGAVELERWLLELMRRGLALADDLADDFFEDMAARMVDAKLSAVGRRIRQWERLRFAENWHERLLEEMAELYLLARSLQRLDDLPPGLQMEALTAAGWTRKRDEVLQEPRITDSWLVAGQVSGADDNLRFRRTWLLGARHSHPALLLDFAWGDAPYDIDWKVGAAVRAELAFYPGAYPLRALAVTQEPYTAPFETVSAYPHFEAMSRAYLEALAASPWLFYFPVLLDSVIVAQRDGLFFLVDRKGRELPLAGACWKLLAISAGHPIRVFGEWDGRLLTPLSALTEERLVAL